MAVFTSFAQEGQTSVERRQYLFTLLGAVALILAMALFHRSYQSLLLAHQKVVADTPLKQPTTRSRPQLTQLNPWSHHRHQTEVTLKLN